jgi:MFS family permease
MLEYYHKVWGVLLLGWLSLYMVRVGMSPILVPMMEEFHLNYAQAGLLSSAVFWAYTSMQIPSGYMGDRWGRRRFLLLGTLCWSVLCLLTGFVTSFALLFLVRFFTGMAQGTFFGNDRPILAAYTPPEKMGMGQGISTIGMGFGMGFGILLAGQIAEWWGWRSVFILYSLPSFLAFLFVLKIIRDPEPALDHQERLEKAQFSIAFKSGNLWMLYLGGFTIMYMFWVLGTWAPAIFLELGVGGIGSSGIYAAVLGFIGIPALYISGVISDKMKKKGQNRIYHLMACLLLISLLAFLMGLGLHLGLGSAWFVVLILLGGFATWSYFPPYYALLPDLVPKRILGTTYGAANTVNFMASLVAPWCTGYLRDQTQSFSWGFYVTGLVALAGFLCVALASRFPGATRELESPLETTSSL